MGGLPSGIMVASQSLVEGSYPAATPWRRDVNKIIKRLAC